MWAEKGFTVEMPATPITYQNWHGSLWRVIDPDTAAAGYFIAGGLAGGATSVDPTHWALTLLREVLASPNTAPANRDPLAAAHITILPDSDGQSGEAGDALPHPLVVLVTDAQGRPVKGAEVTFRLLRGQGCFQACAAEGEVNPDTLTVATNARGIASVTWILGTRTTHHPIYLQRYPEDRYPTVATLNLIEATVTNAQGHPLTPHHAFHLITFPKPLFYIYNTNPRLRGQGRDGSFDGNPGRLGEAIHVWTMDRYGNPVSNVKLRFAAVPRPDQQAQCPLGATLILTLETFSVSIQGHDFTR